MPQRTPELLAPAGNPACAEAALDAGADAIYLGLPVLNARRGAANFTPAQMAATVLAAHAKGAKVYLTLNIDLSERETGTAARVLQLAMESGVDGVLVRDPALLCLLPAFPELAFHFSTQAACANSLDVRLAGELGLKRVVLARELTLDEIRAASGVDDVETEVFVQGALCFCVSGRCLLSSWGGGHSGNRGTCTSPCRVPWSSNGVDLPVFSMHDLSALPKLAALAEAGVSCLKIEGRLKKPDWVSEATRLYRNALDGASAAALSVLAERLGAYTGRRLTCGYLDGRRDDLTGDAGRPAADTTGREPESEREEPRTEGYTLAFMEAFKGLTLTLTCGEHTESWVMPRSQVRRENRASTVSELCEWLKTTPVQQQSLLDFQTNVPHLLVPPRNVKHLLDHISAALHRAKKPAAEAIRHPIPDTLRAMLEKDAPHPRNTLPLGSHPKHARLQATQADLAPRLKADSVTFEGAVLSRLERIAAHPGDMRIALPPVFYEHEIPSMRELVRRCAELDLMVEANSWGGIFLARETGAPFVIGPAMGILNSLAARTFAALGAQGVTASIEADREKLEDLSRHCPLPLTVIVYGRPVLAVTRAEVDGADAEASYADRRNIVLRATRERSLTILRPDLPFDISRIRNNGIRAAAFVADLAAAPDPMEDWNDLWLPREDAYSFNYHRTLA